MARHRDLTKSVAATAFVGACVLLSSTVVDTRNANALPESLAVSGHSIVTRAPKADLWPVATSSDLIPFAKSLRGNLEFFIVSQGGNWCGPSVELAVSAKDKRHFGGLEFDAVVLDFEDHLGEKCPQAETLLVTGEVEGQAVYWAVGTKSRAFLLRFDRKRESLAKAERRQGGATAPGSVPQPDFARETLVQVERLLNRGNFGTPKSDGVVDATTVDAVEAFQREIGAPVDGHITKPLISLLVSYNARDELTDIPEDLPRSVLLEAFPTARVAAQFDVPMDDSITRTIDGFFDQRIYKQLRRAGYDTAFSISPLADHVNQIAHALGLDTKSLTVKELGQLAQALMIVDARNLGIEEPQRISEAIVDGRYPLRHRDMYLASMGFGEAPESSRELREHLQFLNSVGSEFDEYAREVVNSRYRRGKFRRLFGPIRSRENAYVVVNRYDALLDDVLKPVLDTRSLAEADAYFISNPRPAVDYTVAMSRASAIYDPLSVYMDVTSPSGEPYYDPLEVVDFLNKTNVSDPSYTPSLTSEVGPGARYERNRLAFVAKFRPDQLDSLPTPFARAQEKRAKFIEEIRLLQEGLERFEGAKFGGDVFSSVGDPNAAAILRLFYRGDYAALFASERQGFDNFVSLFGFTPRVKESSMFQMISLIATSSRYSNFIAEYAVVRSEVIGLCGEPSATFTVRETETNTWYSGLGVHLSSQTFTTTRQFTVPAKFSKIVGLTQTSTARIGVIASLASFLATNGACETEIRQRLERNMLEYQSYNPPF